MQCLWGCFVVPDSNHSYKNAACVREICATDARSPVPWQIASGYGLNSPAATRVASRLAARIGDEVPRLAASRQLLCIDLANVALCALLPAPREGKWCLRFRIRKRKRARLVCVLTFNFPVGSPSARGKAHTITVSVKPRLVRMCARSTFRGNLCARVFAIVGCPADHRSV